MKLIRMAEMSRSATAFTPKQGQYLAFIYAYPKAFERHSYAFPPIWYRNAFVVVLMPIVVVGVSVGGTTASIMCGVLLYVYILTYLFDVALFMYHQGRVLNGDARGEKIKRRALNLYAMSSLIFVAIPIFVFLPLWLFLSHGY